jgi:hypothetical protein
MGLFDTLTCHYPLPGLSDPTSIQFQTTDLECSLGDDYTITREGRLIKHHKEYEECPEKQRPYYGTPQWNNWFGPLAGSLRVTAGSERDIDTNYHGWLHFYGGHTGELRMIDPHTGRDQLHPEACELFEYRAKFTDGKIVELVRVNAKDEKG